MSKKKIIAIAITIICALLFNVYIFCEVRPCLEKETCKVEINMSTDTKMDVQLFYAEDIEFTEEKSIVVSCSKIDEPTDVEVRIPVNSRFLRIDFGEGEERKVQITDAKIRFGHTDLKMDLKLFEEPIIQNNLLAITQNEDAVEIDTGIDDPHIIVSLDNLNFQEEYLSYINKKYLMLDIFLCILVDLLAVLCISRIRVLTITFLDIYRNRDLLWDLAKNDLQNRFAGSYFGVVWAFVQPVVTMLLYWFVFQVGIRAGRVSDYPFILFLMSGLIPWFYFSETLGGATNSLLEYSYLVKKMVFEIGVLPVIKIISAIFVHLFFVAFIIVMCLLYGYKPDVYLLQLLYYIPAMSFLVLGISYITSSVVVFFRDMSQIVNIALSIGVWLTPIMWNLDSSLSPILQVFFKLNPMYYIVDGFRDALLAKVWFWDKPIWTVYFWIFSFLVYFVGISLFNRLKVHFSDVL